MPKNEIGKAFINYYYYLKEQRKIEKQEEFDRIKHDLLDCTKNLNSEEKKCRENIIKILEVLK